MGWGTRHLRGISSGQLVYSPVLRTPWKACVRSGPQTVRGGDGKPRLRQNRHWVRMFEGRLGRRNNSFVLSDFQADTEKGFTSVCGPAGLESVIFTAGFPRRMLQREIETVCTVQKKKVVCDWMRHTFLGKNAGELVPAEHKFDSESPCPLCW